MQTRNGPGLFPDLSNSTPTKMGHPTTPVYGQSPGTPYRTGSPGTPFVSPTPSHLRRGSMQRGGRGYHRRGSSRGGRGSPTPFRTTPNTTMLEYCEIQFANKVRRLSIHEGATELIRLNRLSVIRQWPIGRGIFLMVELTCTYFLLLVHLSNPQERRARGPVYREPILTRQQQFDSRGVEG